MNWFQRDPEDGHFLWPGYRDNLRALLWLLDVKEGRAEGVQTPVGILPKKEELNLDDFEGDDADLDKLLSIDTDLWKKEMGYRREHLAQFKNLPEQIWAAHERIEQAFNV